jgi:hypothetical protein
MPGPVTSITYEDISAMVFGIDIGDAVVAWSASVIDYFAVWMSAAVVGTE